jgi:hypothetical protein
MGDLIRQQRYFLQLFVQTSSKQRRALLDTVTQPQLRVLSEIAHNITRGQVTLTPSEQAHLKRERRLIHLLGDKKLGYKHKQKLVRTKQRTLHLLVKIAVTYLESVLQ